MERNLPPNNQNNLMTEDILRKILFHHGYILKESIGQGGYGKIYKILFEKEKKELIVKHVMFDEKTELGMSIKEYTLKESEILWNIRHENIIKLYQIINIDNGLLLIIELANHGDILKYLDTNLDESVAFAIFYKIYSGVKILHQNQIIHRDLKLENILVNDNYEIKICDFGLSKTITEAYIGEGDDQKTRIRNINFNRNESNSNMISASFVGSPLYLSPEIIKTSECYYDSVDVWSLGIILYVLLFNKYPFNVEVVNMGEFEKKIIKAEPQIDIKLISKDCYDLLINLLKKDYKSRIRIKAIEQSKWIVDKKKAQETHFMKLKEYLSSKLEGNIFVKKNNISESLDPHEKENLSSNEENLKGLNQSNNTTHNSIFINRHNFNTNEINKIEDVGFNSHREMSQSTYIVSNNKNHEEIKTNLRFKKMNENQEVIRVIPSKTKHTIMNNFNQKISQNEWNDNVVNPSKENQNIFKPYNNPGINHNVRQQLVNQNYNLALKENNNTNQNINKNQINFDSQNKNKNKINKVNEYIEKYSRFRDLIEWLIQEDVPNLIENQDFKQVITIRKNEFNQHHLKNQVNQSTNFGKYIQKNK